MANAEGKSTIRTVDQLETVVDADFHMWESQEDYLPYIDDPWKSMLERFSFGWDELPSFNDRLRTFTGIMGKLPETDRYNVHTQEKVLAGMEETGSDHILLSGSQMLYINTVHHDEFAHAMARAWNRWMLDEILDSKKGIHGLMHIAVHIPDKAAEHIDDLANEDDIKGIIISSGGVNQPLGHRRYHQIYEAAEDNGLPVTFHGAAPTFTHSFPHRAYHTSRFIDAHALSHPLDHMMHLSTMLTHGVFERYPNVDFVFQEAGLGWAPYLAYRYDNEYSGLREDAPLLKKTPSEYVKEHCYVTTQPLEGYAHPELVQANIRAIGGSQNVMYSSDWPHHDFDHSSHLLKSLKGEFVDDEINDIYCNTGKNVFGV
ncbi:amidohydrolase family protein [Natrialbaceae archaeon A-CW1-1]